MSIQNIFAEDIAAGREITRAELKPDPVFYYDGARYYLDSGREFIPMDQRSVNRHLKQRGVQPTEMDKILCEIQTDRFIHFAGPLAGKARGLHEMSGMKLLATVSPRIIQPKAGDWPTLKAVIGGLLKDDDAGMRQVYTFMAWLKVARESLVSGKRRPGQALALAGPRGCGKSLLIDITEAALGGRRANPYKYFSGRTNFNADLAGAELLAVDDEAGSTDFRSRMKFSASIKSCLFSGGVAIEGKHRNSFNFAPCWRMMVALNDEAEALLVLPPITEDVGDKITLFRCHKAPLPMPTFTMDQREEFFAALMAELPALLAFLETWPIPGDIQEDRCGVTYYHHPHILAALHQLSPEGQLVALIDTAAAAGGISLPWQGTASELKAMLATCHTVARDTEKLLYTANSAGTYLARLEGKRVSRLTIRDGIQRWQVDSVEQWNKFSH